MDTRVPAALAAVFVLLFALACSRSAPATPEPTIAAAPTSAAQSAPAPTSDQACTSAATGGEQVAIAGFQYTPQELTVAAGTTVVWTNNDADAHTVTFDGGPDCGRLEQGGTVGHEFDTAGTFTYMCTIHPDMRASIIVE